MNSIEIAIDEHGSEFWNDELKIFRPELGTHHIYLDLTELTQDLDFRATHVWMTITAFRDAVELPTNRHLPVLSRNEKLRLREIVVGAAVTDKAEATAEYRTPLTVYPLVPGYNIAGSPTLDLISSVEGAARFVVIATDAED